MRLRKTVNNSRPSPVRGTSPRPRFSPFVSTTFGISVAGRLFPVTRHIGLGPVRSRVASDLAASRCTPRLFTDAGPRRVPSISLIRTELSLELQPCPDSRQPQTSSVEDRRGWPLPGLWRGSASTVGVVQREPTRAARHKSRRVAKDRSSSRSGLAAITTCRQPPRVAGSVRVGVEIGPPETEHFTGWRVVARQFLPDRRTDSDHAAASPQALQPRPAAIGEWPCDGLSPGLRDRAGVDLTRRRTD